MKRIGQQLPSPVAAGSQFLCRSAAVAGLLFTVAACTAAEPDVDVAPPDVAAPSRSLVVDSGSPSAMSVRASQAVWVTSPAAITVAADGPVSEASGVAVERGVPVLVLPHEAAQVDESGEPRPALVRAAAELTRLGTTHVVHLGPGAPDLPEVEVVGAVDELPEGEAVSPLEGLVAVTVTDKEPSGAEAALATLQAAGARPLAVSRADPRVRAEDVTAVAEADPAVAVGVGSRFGASDVFAQRIEAAATGRQLPGGGQTVFDGKRYVALYGHPLSASLGVLGEQGPQAAVRRARTVAGAYESLTDDTIVPAFEIIATVATGGAGDDGDYSAEWDIDVLQPLVDAAEEAGFYVLLDLQPGRSDFLSQARLYRKLLRGPNVGLALDPEWRLKKGEKPLQQIGSVSSAEINRTTRWLARLTDENDLPQKMVLLHQFTTSMITDRQDLDLSHDELSLIVQMDGDGTLGQKLGTWSALRAGAPAGLRFGWKNFYDEDEPTPSPATTFRVSPTPWWVSYQ